jgi:ribonuclease HII
MQAYYRQGEIEIGVDEVGRGCLAGSVVAAAVVLPAHFDALHINDSKTLSAQERVRLSHHIKTHALAYAIAEASVAEIEQINILQATFLAMHRAIAKLIETSPISPHRLLIDGNRFKPYPNIEHLCFVKGDTRYLPIAAASIIAKTYRDQLMTDLAQEFPQYGWQNNAGYPTAQHRKAIAQFGITPHHRKTFKLLPNEGLFGNTGG